MSNDASTPFRILSPRAILDPVNESGDESDALANVVTTTLPDGAIAYVQSQQAYYRLDKFSSDPAIFPATVSGNNGGVWKQFAGGSTGLKVYAERLVTELEDVFVDLATFEVPDLTTVNFTGFIAATSFDTLKARSFINYFVAATRNDAPPLSGLSFVQIGSTASALVDGTDVQIVESPANTIAVQVARSSVVPNSGIWFLGCFDLLIKYDPDAPQPGQSP